MKAERRHELQTNTLAAFLTDLPLYLRFHANKILIGVIVVCILILLVRHRINAAAEAKNATANSLATAQRFVEQLAVQDSQLPTDIARAQQRKKIIGDVQMAVAQVLEQTSDANDPALRAEAKLAEANMYWTLANLPVLPGASTMPGASVDSTADLLNKAETGYQNVLKNYGSQKLARTTALFSLAAIEENRHNFDKAKEYYQKLSSDKEVPVMFQNLAKNREALLPKLKTPVYIGTFSSTQPTSAPSTTESTLGASTRPDDVNVVDRFLAPLLTTQPSSQPASQPSGLRL